MTIDTRFYGRVSDPRQATEDKVSLAVQQRACEEMASRLQRTLTLGGHYIDRGVSGATAKRPEFQRLVADCLRDPRPAKDGLVLVYRDDRWGRFENPDEASHWRFLLAQAGWRVRFTIMDSDDDNVDPIFRTLGTLQGRAERRTIQDRARVGMRGAVESGHWVNHEPFGYRRQAVDKLTSATRILAPGQRKGGNERLKLAPGPVDEVAFVAWLFERYGEGTISIDELKLEARVRWPKPWHWSTIHRMLRNPVYAGDLRAGHRGGRDSLLIPNAFPALVDRNLWDRVQQIIDRNSKETSPVRYEYPLSGLFQCATCGKNFVGGGRGGPRPPDHPLANFQYVDLGARNLKACPGKQMSFLRREVEPKVFDAIATVIEQHDLAPRLAQAFDRILATSDTDRADRQGQLRRQQTELEARRARLLEAVAQGTVLRAEAEPLMRHLRTQLDRLAGELERTRFDARRHVRLTAERDRLVAIATDFRGLTTRLAGTELRELLRPWIRTGLVDKHRRVLTLEIRTVPAVPQLDSFTASAGPAGEAPTVTVVIRLKSKSEWAKQREAAKRAKRLQAVAEKPKQGKRLA